MNKPIEELRAKARRLRGFWYGVSEANRDENQWLVPLSDAEEIIKRQVEKVGGELKNTLIKFAQFLEDHGAENLTSGIEPYVEYFAKEITGE